MFTSILAVRWHAGPCTVLSYGFSFLASFTIYTSCLVSSVLLHSAPVNAALLTLEEAWRLAEEANPALRETQARLNAATGEVEDTRAMLFNNPEVFGELRNRKSESGVEEDSHREGTLGLSQTFETGGQQVARRAAARQILAATEENIREARQQVRFEVETRFINVLSLQERVQTEQKTLQLVEQAARIAQQRVTAGEDSQLEGNLAKVEAERGQNQVALLHEQLTQARAELATLLQLPFDTLPDVSGSLNPTVEKFTLDDLLASATHRPALRGLEFRENAARSQLQVERGAVYPDVTLSLFQEREKGIDNVDDITGVSISLPLPIFRRNAAGIGRAMTELTQTQIERQTASRDARAQVSALWQKLKSLRARLARLEQSVLPSLEENLSLSQKSYQEGEIGITQLLLVNRQALDARRDVLDARTSLRLNQTALEAAAGWSATSNVQ